MSSVYLQDWHMTMSVSGVHLGTLVYAVARMPPQLHHTAHTCTVVVYNNTFIRYRTSHCLIAKQRAPCPKQLPQPPTARWWQDPNPCYSGVLAAFEGNDECGTARVQNVHRSPLPHHCQNSHSAWRQKGTTIPQTDLRLRRPISVMVMVMGSAQGYCSRFEGTLTCS